MNRIALFFVVAVYGCTNVDNWTPKDTALYTVSASLIAADAYTTAKIQDDPNLVEVGQPTRQILGQNPSTTGTIVYFATSAAIIYIVAVALPDRWRPLWLGFSMVNSGVAVWTNCRNGLC